MSYEPSNTSILLHCTPHSTQIEQALAFLQTRLEWIEAGQILNHPDIHVIGSEEETASIEAIRQMIQDMAMTPFQASQSVFVVVGIEKTSVPAQNALLKSLEEPAEHVQILLTSTQPEKVLPTILSRCVVMKSGEWSKRTPNLQNDSRETGGETAELVSQLTSASFTDIFALSEKYKERDAALQVVDQLTTFLHHKNQMQPEKQQMALLQKLLITRDLLEKNVNVRLVLEELFFAFRSRQFQEKTI